MVARALGEGEKGMTVNGYGVFLWTDENVLKRDSGDSCTIM